ncbi:MAG: HAMP domain-containing histidine kinase [Microscillaceae bacterium]|nr:HAMP domain-containing histidine kinase [Microscillaceae bacterium]MDW8460800.1 HAMP domain-containing sensor histidine kinase [Cytophagales bacterium]
MNFLPYPTTKVRKKKPLNGFFISIYDNKSQIKWLFWLIAACLALLSLVYTNIIVNELEAEEAKQIDFYSKALEFVVKPEVNEDLTFLLKEIIEANQTIPVILTKADKKTIISYKNIPRADKATSAEEKAKILQNELAIMQDQYEPILIYYGEKQYVFFRNSERLLQLRYYPFVQMSVIALFGLLAYLTFSYSRKAEQNRVWVGLAKETAHQLGTPITALSGWIEYLKADESFQEHRYILPELEKDIEKIKIVAERFSHIGSEPKLHSQNISQVIQEVVSYLEKRMPSKIKLILQNQLSSDTEVLLDKYLFDWVIENICKNAIDAMPTGTGGILISLSENTHNVIIDIKDTGKGMTKSQIKQVFNPGFTTKQRGWGLGLTLAKRIVEEYHKGKIWVKYSEPNKGTIFRITLPKANKKKFLFDFQKFNKS